MPLIQLFTLLVLTLFTCDDLVENAHHKVNSQGNNLQMKYPTYIDHRIFITNRD